MRYKSRGPILAGFAALLLVACGGGGGGDGGGQNPPANVPPTANAGAAQTVTAGATVTLNGSASSDSDGAIAGYAWTQTAGTPAVTLSSATVAQPTFTAPTVTAAATLTFSLVVTDNRGAASPASSVIITVNPPPANAPPVANAGAGQVVTSGADVTLNGQASSDPDGTIAAYAWTQTAGTTVALTGASTAQPTFTAPSVATTATLTFSLTVTDNQGAVSPAASVTVTVNPVSTGNVVVSGTIRYQRVNFGSAPTAGLNYGNQTLHPARGIVVRALEGASTTVLASAMTNDNGGYSLTVPANTSIRIQAVAQLLRPSTGSPSWNFQVMDGREDDGALKPNPTVYQYTDAAFNSSTTGAHDVAIPSGFNSSGTATGVRASGPFAILDTVYTATQTVLSVSANADFPELILDWAEDNPGGETYYDSNVDMITLSADPDADSDEFDPHVIAHEFGHYIEDSFSRADNIGGSHGLGDKLDIRVAFGEGFGYAFAAIVLDDPVARDSYVNGSGTRVSSTFNVETNPPSFPTGPSDQNYGCFCSESSVWSILWDLYDSDADANDSLALGFGPIWNVLVGEQRTTPAFTSIYSFMTALKTARPADVTAINLLLTAQNIVVTDAFATGESNVPAIVPSSAALPLYTQGTIGGTLVLFSTDDAGTYNTLGNRRFIRFNVTGAPRTITVTAYSSNTNTPVDTDFVVYRNGTVVATGFSLNGSAQSPEERTFTATQNGTHLIDVYDCGNGCDEGTSGDYNLTVTIN